MIWLISGLALWWVAHLVKRLASGFRARLTERMGDASRGLFALAILASVVLMVVGYKAADTTFFWGRNAATTGINNLLVLLGFYMFAASGAKTRVTQFTRHPQLAGFSLWAVAHLLVNGDTASLVLFGGLLLWALVEMAVISRQEGPYAPPPPPPMKKEVTAVIASVVLFGVVAGIHAWLGYNPFGA